MAMPPSAGDMADNEQGKLVWLSFIDSRIPPEGHTLSLDTARNLDDELQLVNEFAALAKRRRNAYASWLCKLPVEVLAVILNEVKNTWRTDMTRRTEYNQHARADANESLGTSLRSIMADLVTRLGWLNVTFVCSIIRKVALASPSLWCEIECNEYTAPFKNLIEMRSAGRPLNFSFDFDPSLRERSYEPNQRAIALTRTWLTPSICNRLHSLKLRNFSRGVLLDIRSLPPLPYLTDVLLTQDSDTETDADITLPIISPQQLLHLAFQNYYPALSNPMFSSSITHLTLSSTSALDPFDTPSANDILRMLSPMSRLEYLWLDHVPGLQAQGRALPSSLCCLPLTFRKLECLVGRDVVPTITFMSHIELPRGVEVDLGIESHFDYEQHRIGGISDFARLSETTLRAAHIPSDSPWSLLLMHCEAYILLGDGRPAHYLRSPADILPWSGSHTDNTLIRLARPTITQLTISDLNGLFLLLPLAHLSSLSICGDLLDTLCMDDLPEYAQILDKILAMPWVRHLTLGLSDNATHLFKRLSEIHSQSGQVPTAVYLPFLETITVGVEDQVDMDNQIDLKESLTPVLGALAAAVNARQNCVNPVRELHIDRQLNSMYAWELVTGAAVVTI